MIGALISFFKKIDSNLFFQIIKKKVTSKNVGSERKGKKKLKSKMKFFIIKNYYKKEEFNGQEGNCICQKTKVGMVAA